VSLTAHGHDRFTGASPHAVDLTICGHIVRRVISCCQSIY
jgi:hypothetical protein